MSNFFYSLLTHHKSLNSRTTRLLRPCCSPWSPPAPSRPSALRRKRPKPLRSSLSSGRLPMLLTSVMPRSPDSYRQKADGDHSTDPSKLGLRTGHHLSKRHRAQVWRQIFPFALSAPSLTALREGIVLLVHGTAAKGDETWANGPYNLFLPTAGPGYDICWVTFLIPHVFRLALSTDEPLQVDLPNRSLGDAQLSAEYVAYGISCVAPSAWSSWPPVRLKHLVALRLGTWRGSLPLARSTSSAIRKAPASTFVSRLLPSPDLFRRASVAD